MGTRAIVFSIIGVILGILALTWVVQGNDFFLLTVFGPKMENARYNAQKESQPYKDGLVKDLYRLQSEYVMADKSHQNALAGVILDQRQRSQLFAIVARVRPLGAEART